MQIKDYQIIETKQNGENANVYVVQNSNNKKFILKHFTKAIKPYLGYGKYNHFVRRREGSFEVFQEIKTISSKFPFLINFHERFKWNNKWCVVIEYFDGITISKYLSDNKDDDDKITRIIRKFADEVSLWHKNKFALGDAHLENVLIMNKLKKSG